MTRFTTNLSTLLYILLIAVLGFAAIVILTSIVVVIGDWVSPGIFGALHVNPRAADLAVPGMAPALIAMLLLALAMAAGALLPLIAMLRSTAKGDPFTSANVRRLHVIAGVMAVGFVAQTILPWVLPFALTDMVKPMGGGGIFALLLTLVLAEVFREGVRLREDAALTV